MQVLLKYTEYNEPHESLTNKNIIDVSGFPHHDDHGHDGEGPHRVVFLITMIMVMIAKVLIEKMSSTDGARGESE